MLGSRGNSDSESLSSRQPSRVLSRQVRQVLSTAAGNTRCFTCGQEGHRADRCPKKPATPATPKPAGAKSAGQSSKKVSFTKLQLNTAVQEAVKTTVQETVTAKAKTEWLAEAVTVRPRDAVVHLEPGHIGFYCVSGQQHCGVIETHNQFDQLEATDSGWEYQPYELAGSRRRPKRRRLVSKCTNCACSVCCAVGTGICALVCPHHDGQTAEQEINSGTPLRRTAAKHREFLTRQVEEDFVRHGFRGLACAPKRSSARLAVATASRVESDSAAKMALNVIAETKALLDVNVVVECPNGEEVVTIARLNTAANTDVVSPKLANVLKSNKVPVQWPAKGGAFVEVCGASSVRPTGFLSVPMAVSSRQLGLPRRLQLNIDACLGVVPA
jgi:hypothetical protein